MIKTISYDQHEILRNILKLCNLQHFHVDVTYGNGCFYRKDIPQPILKYDIDPQKECVQKESSDCLPIDSGTIESLIYDPPFLTYVKNARSHKNGDVAMSRRYGGYWRYDELENDYKKAILEANRVLRKKGFFVVKCQDVIHNHKIHATHVNVINWAGDYGFRLKDLFILNAKHRMPGPQAGIQRHARIYHCYFLVFVKTKDVQK